MSAKPAGIRFHVHRCEFGLAPLSESILGHGHGQGARRDQVHATHSSNGFSDPVDVAAFAVHLVTNSAVTGAVFVE